MTKPKTRPRRWLWMAVVLGLATQFAWQSLVNAAAITNAQVAISDPRPGAGAVTYQFNFTVTSTTVLRAFSAEVCESTSGACVTPAGFSAATATLASQPSNFGDAVGWQDDSITGAARFKKAANATAPSGLQSVTFTNITNPTDQGAYIVKLKTYSDDAYSAPVDQASVVFAVVPGVQISAVVDPTLSFSVTGVPPSTPYKGSLTTSDRCVNSSNVVKFGTSGMPLLADTDYDCAQTLTTSTNGQGGYQVTVTGNVPGDDLRHTGDPNFTIQDWLGTNSAPTIPTGADELFAYTTNDSTLSGTPDRFTVADELFAGLDGNAGEVAYANAPVSADSVNVGYRLRFYGYTEAGTYTGTVTYTCTATF
jgi:hypothetical protein